MIEPSLFQEMRINEKGAFADKVLAKANPYGEKDADMKSLIDDANTKNQIFGKALEKLSLVAITKLMHEGDDLRDGGISNLEGYALSCSKRKDPVWAAAGQEVVNALRAIGWNMNYRGNKEETKLVDLFLAQIEAQPTLKQALTTISAQGWIDEIREGQASYKLHDAQREAADKPGGSITSREAARELGVAIDKLFRYVNFQIEFKDSADCTALANEINKTIAEYRVTMRQRATTSQKKGKK
ncbi:DUF6261 family protein [Alistipes sp. ZOR0009]|uniref:DUF6261 family protein n=1 Tax=Alistipes sp. ZOR0009 TaxID=1339253 RepID=UPI0006472F87|nr:DUF6261 family protein [Alistipes sp. ZOR0009]